MSRTDISNEKLTRLVRKCAADGMVLLKNEESTLPLGREETVSLFGRCQIDYYRSGTGSGGAVNVPYEINALEGFREMGISLNEELAAQYESWVEDNPFDDGGGGWAAEPWFQKEMPLNEEITERAARHSQKALIIIGRTAGEDKDNADREGSYRLTKEERDMLRLVTARFEKTAVILNTANIIDMSWIDDPEYQGHIKAVLYAWQGGIEGGRGLADVVSGDVSPGGKLSDTIAYDLADYPSADNFGKTGDIIYREDIYVGYRYFETFAPEKVRYEFGFGLSYTDFEWEILEADLKNGRLDKESRLDIEVRVRNTGLDRPGREIIQLYYSAPQGKLGKAALELGAFCKTRTLAPGEEETLRLSLDVRQMASYDDRGVTGHKSCYVLEEGEYLFFLGNSSRNTRPVLLNGKEGHILDRLCLVAQLSQAVAPEAVFTRLKPGSRRSDGVFEALYEDVPRRTDSMEERINENLPAPLEGGTDRGIRLAHVKEGEKTLEDFVSQFSDEELAILVRGEGMCSPKVVPGTASAFGGVTEELYRYGIPRACCADGPSGIRMDSGHKATQVPIGTLLACTWDSALVEELYEGVGEELAAYGIDTLLGPGINIHRHPLNGRNFEYFSEDPCLTGAMAAVVVRGLASKGSAATVKHYACNDQEMERHNTNSVISERALREIHLKPFEAAVKEGGAVSVMTSYNAVNGIWGASNYDLNTTILRKEWGFEGIVMTDWWAKMNHNTRGGKADKKHTSYMIRAQNDLYMVTGNEGAQTNPHEDDTARALLEGTLTRGELQRCAINICRFIMNAPCMGRPLIPFDPVITPSTPSLRENCAFGQIGKGEVFFDTKVNASRFMEVLQAGLYRLRAALRYSKPPMAQSSCSLYINGEYAASLPVNGTEGKWIEHNTLLVRLESGIYEFSLDFVKKGMEVGRMSLDPEEE